MQLPGQYQRPAVGFSTNELAEQLRGTPGSIRVRLCETGSYFGIKPLKLPSGRLLWPADSLEQLAAYSAAKPLPSPIEAPSKGSKQGVSA